MGNAAQPMKHRILLIGQDGEQHHERMIDMNPSTIIRHNGRVYQYQRLGELTSEHVTLYYMQTVMMDFEDGKVSITI